MAINLNIHGSCVYSASVRSLDQDGNAVDLSSRTLWFDVADTNIRVALTPDPNDALGQLLFLPLDIVDSIAESPTLFAIIDETDTDKPTLVVQGTIRRGGFVS